MNEIIRLGYEVPTGEPVEAELSHLVVTGVTQKAGKTTALERFMEESNKDAIVFLTKRGEESFQRGEPIQPYFANKMDWEYLRELLEATTKQKLKYEEAEIINLCKAGYYHEDQREVNTIQDAKHNVDLLMDLIEEGEINLGRSENVFTRLQAYFDKVVPRIEEADFATELKMEKGLNIVDLREFDTEIQMLVIASVLEEVYKNRKDTVVVVPEAWKFVPQRKGSPVKEPVEHFIRQGASNGNYLWIDSQDMTGVDKQPLKQISDWVLGVQFEENEVDKTRDQIPMPKRKAPGKEEIMGLDLGHFLYCGSGSDPIEIYVAPVWIDDLEINGFKGEELAKKVAQGELSVQELNAARQGENVEISQKELDVSSSEGETESEIDTEKVKQLEAKAGNLQNKLDEKKETVADLEENLEEKESKITNLENNLERYKEDYEELENSLNQIREALNVDSGIQKGEVKEIVEEKVQQVLPEVVEEMDIEKSVSTTNISNVQDLVMEDYREEAVDRVMEKVDNLSDNQKKMLLFIESRGSTISSQTRLIKSALNYLESTSPTSSVRSEARELIDQGFIHKNKDNSLKPQTKEKVEEILERYEVDQETVDSTYQKILSEIKKSVESGK